MIEAADFEREGLRQPPCAIESEQAVLGGLMIANESFPKVADWLQPDDFFRRDHQLIYRAIIALAELRKPFDVVTVGEWFEDQGNADEVEGGAYLIDLVSSTPSAANIVAYAEIVKEKARLRSLIDIGTDLADRGYSPGGMDVSEIVMDTSRRLSEVKGGPRTAGFVLASAGLNDWFEDLQNRYQNGGALTGLPYPWSEVNRVTHGLQDGELTIIAGRPSMGKSIAGLNLALMTAMRGDRTAYVSLEMTRRQINRRNIASLGDVPHEWLLDPANDKYGDYWGSVSEAIRKLKAAPLLVDDSSGLKISQIAARLRRAHMQEPIRLIVLDHMHDVVLPGKKDARFEVGDIAGAGKDLAKEFNCPAVWLAQLNRNLEARQDKRPTMADLRESGEIEQKADVIWFLYREDYYQRNTPGYEPTRAVELILGKGRDLNVDSSSVTLRAEFDRMRMVDWDEFTHGPVPGRYVPQKSGAGGMR